MKHYPLVLVLLSACDLYFSGGQKLDADSVETDAAVVQDAAVDASVDAQLDAGVDAPGAPAAFIVCSNELVDGLPKVALTFSGDIQSGLLGDQTAAAPLEIDYGSDQEDLAVTNSCQGTWVVPYSPGCHKPGAAWGPSPKLYLEPEVDRLNVAVRYADGTVRWGDLKTSDGDSVGFVVSGLDCRIELTEGGAGGYIRTHPDL